MPLVSNINPVLSQEHGLYAVDFLGSLDNNTLIVAPQFLQDKILSVSPNCSAQWATSAIERPPQAKNIIVCAENAIRERQILASFDKFEGVECFGLYHHVIPAMTSRKIPFDIRRDDGEINKYALLCLPRSGSTFLCALLTRAGYGIPLEHLRVSASYLLLHTGLDFNRWLDMVENYGQVDGVFGTKFLTSFLVISAGRRYTRFEFLISQLMKRQYKILHLKRNIVDCAVSIAIAWMTKIWHIYDEEDEMRFAQNTEAIKVNDALVDDFVTQTLAEIVIIESALRPYSVMNLHYEELRRSPLGVIEKISQYLGTGNGAMEDAIRMPKEAKRNVPGYITVRQIVRDRISEYEDDLAALTMEQIQRKTGLGESNVRRRLGIDACGVRRLLQESLET